MKKKEKEEKFDESKRNTPPYGVPVDCCDAIQRVWEAVYGDDRNLNPGLVRSVNKLEETANRIEIQADLIAKSMKFFGLNTVKGLLALIGWVISAIFLAKNFLLK